MEIAPKASLFIALVLALAVPQVGRSQEAVRGQFPLIPTGQLGDPFGIHYQDQGMKLRNMAALPSVAEGIDVDVAIIERRPRLRYDENNLQPGGLPGVDSEVTFVAHVNNRGTRDGGPCDYEWTVNGAVVESGTLDVVGQDVTTSYRTIWRAQPVQIGFSCQIQSGTDLFPENNSLRINSHALNVGLWVHRSVYDYFNAHQSELGVGSNSFEDWANRLCAYWNHFFERSIYPSAPNGAVDRVHLDKVVIHDDPLSPTPLFWGNHPDDFDGPGDTHDRTLDYLWGIPAEILSGSFYTGRAVSLSNHFYFEHPLMHEMMHGRILQDSYSSNWKIHQSVLDAPISASATSLVLQGPRRVSMRAKNRSAHEHFLSHEGELIGAPFAWSSRPTEQPAYASGSYDPSGGFSGGALRVVLGGEDDEPIEDIAGGWSRSFSLSTEQAVTLNLRYRLLLSGPGNLSRYVETLADFDGGIVSTGFDGYLHRLFSDGQGDTAADSGWQQTSLTCWLSAGTHKLTVGAYSNGKTRSEEIAEILLDDIILTAPAEDAATVINARFDTDPDDFVYLDDPFQDLTRFQPLVRGAGGTLPEAHAAGARFFRADCRIIEGGELLMGSDLLPLLPPWRDHLFVTRQIGMMGGSRDSLILSEIHALLYNYLAHTRSPIGNRNWSGHGQYLRVSDPEDKVPHAYEREVPASNVLRVLDTGGQPVAGATVELYQAQASAYGLPWYPKFIDGEADFTGVTDIHGEILFEDDPATAEVNEGNPFGKLVIDSVAVSEIMIAKVAHGTRTDYVFLEASTLLQQLFRNLVNFGEPSYHPAVLPVVVDWSQGHSTEAAFELRQGDDSIVIDERGNLLLNGNSVYYNCVWEDHPQEIVWRTQNHAGAHLHSTDELVLFELRNRGDDRVFAIDYNLNLHLRGASIETASYPMDYASLRMIRNGAGDTIANFDRSGCLVLAGIVVE